MKEAEGNIADAADILQEVAVVGHALGGGIQHSMSHVRTAAAARSALVGSSIRSRAYASAAVLPLCGLLTCPAALCCRKHLEPWPRQRRLPTSWSRCVSSCRLTLEA
jgi:hypothetical protein